jgi:RHS repeat-associated protein
VSATKYTFNLDGQLTRVLRPDSLAIDVAYDTAGRPSQLTLPNGQMQFAYSPTTGNVTTLSAPGANTINYTYDGFLPKTVTWSGAVQGTVEFAYDSNLRISGIAVNGTDSVAVAYDKDDLLNSIGAMTLVRDSFNGRLVRTVIGNDTSSWTYDDSTGAISHYSAVHGATMLFDVAYTRDSLDRIVVSTETVQGTTTTKAFAYDSLGRLEQVRVNGVVVSDYDYDANGNRVGITTSTGVLTGLYDDQDRLLSYGGATYTHTANGELKRKVSGVDTTLYLHDVLGNLLQVRLPNGRLIDYVVDAQNRRIGRKVDGTLLQAFLYQGQLAPAAELDGNGNVVSRFVYGTRRNVPEYMVKQGITYRLVTDALGSVRLVVNAVTGALAQRLDYDEFGRVTLNSSPGFQPFGFAGGLYDSETGLVRFGSRDYDPTTGRWIAKDPIGFLAGTSNVFSYSSNDPVNAVDPDGECAQQCGKPNRRGFGGGVWAGISAELGNGVLGAAGSAGAAAGVFGNSESFSAAGYGNYGLFLGGPGFVRGIPDQHLNQGGFVFGGSVGTAIGGFLTNAGTYEDLRGPFTTTGFSAGPVAASLSLGTNAIGETIWQISLGRAFGPESAVSVYRYETNTVGRGWRRWRRLPNGCIVPGTA